MTAPRSPSSSPPPSQASPPRLLVIQIPCLDERDTLPAALAALPREVEGYDRVEWLVVDDGSTDGTADVARAHGADHIVAFRHNRGLARAYCAGLEAALALGADTVVNTDADNQYDAACIPALVAPILAGEAELVVGERPVMDTAHWSPLKKTLQRLGSRAVRWASNTDVPDAPSGFRAIHREAAMRLFVQGEYTYTLETLIQAGRQGMRVASVPVRTNPDTRPSRLMRSMRAYVQRSAVTIVRTFLAYKPLRVFAGLGALLGLAALLLGARFLWAWANGEGDGHVQSLILLSVLAMAGFVSLAVGVLADLLNANRRLLEDVRLRLLRAELEEAARERRFRDVRSALQPGSNADTDTDTLRETAA